jgi:hypothetical protein
VTGRSRGGLRNWPAAGAEQGTDDGADGANCLAVVPVFVNAGVAILPAVIASE